MNFGNSTETQHVDVVSSFLIDCERSAVPALKSRINLTPYDIADEITHFVVGVSGAYFNEPSNGKRSWLQRAVHWSLCVDELGMSSFDIGRPYSIDSSNVQNVISNFGRWRTVCKDCEIMYQQSRTLLQAALSEKYGDCPHTQRLFFSRLAMIAFHHRAGLQFCRFIKARGVLPQEHDLKLLLKQSLNVVAARLFEWRTGDCAISGRPLPAGARRELYLEILPLYRKFANAERRMKNRIYGIGFPTSHFVPVSCQSPSKISSQAKRIHNIEY